MSPPTLFSLPQRSVIEVRGADRSRWLNGMISNEISDLQGEKNGCPAVLLSRQGRVIADLHVLVLPDCIWLELESDFTESVIKELDRYIIADRVELQNLARRISRYCIEGEEAIELIRRVSKGSISEHRYAGSEVQFEGLTSIVANYELGSPSGVQIFLPSENAAEFEELLFSSEKTLVKGTAEAFEVSRVIAGRPRLGAELDETVLPDEANLGDAISTTKGCYIGQEVIARLRSRGKIKHQLVGLLFDEHVSSDSSLTSFGKKVGEVTSVVFVEGLGVAGLGFVQVEQSDPGTQLKVGKINVKVVSLPMAIEEKS